MTYKYLIVTEKTETGYSSYSPDVPGCVATGKTRASSEKLLKEAIEFHLEGLAEIGESAPKPQARHTFAHIKRIGTHRSSSKVYHVVRGKEGWFVKNVSTGRFQKHSTKDAAVEAAKKHLTGDSRVIVYNRNGTVRSLETSSPKSTSRKAG